MRNFATLLLGLIVASPLLAQGEIGATTEADQEVQTRSHFLSLSVVYRLIDWDIEETEFAGQTTPNQSGSDAEIEMQVLRFGYDHRSPNSLHLGTSLELGLAEAAIVGQPGQRLDIGDGAAANFHMYLGWEFGLTDTAAEHGHWSVVPRLEFMWRSATVDEEGSLVKFDDLALRADTSVHYAFEADTNRYELFASLFVDQSLLREVVVIDGLFPDLTLVLEGEGLVGARGGVRWQLQRIELSAVIVAISEWSFEVGVAWTW